MTFDLFVLGGDTFFTVYICFKETLFFNFSYKLFNISPFSEHLPVQSASKEISDNSYMYVRHCHNFIVKEEAIHMYNYRRFWKGLCFSYLISNLWF